MSMRLFLIVLVLFANSFASVHLLAQTAGNVTDEKGLKQGFWRKTFPDGTTRYEGSFIDDKPDGVFKYYEETGSLKMVCFYHEKGTRSHCKGFDEKGNIISDGNYIGREKDSVWTYYNENKQVVARETYISGVKTGTWYVYYPDGKVSEEMSYENNLRNGPWKQYFEDGTVRLAAHYKDGLLQGRMTYYFANGKPKLMGNYLDDRRQGTWYHYEESGNIKETEVFKDGMPEKPRLINTDKLDINEEEFLNTPPAR
jgi:antitoxin component YwqK of YwqJK toxin-antitoxin module